VPWHHLPRRNPGNLIQRGEPAAQAPIYHRDVLDEDEIAGKQRLAGIVQHGKIIVRVGGRPLSKREHVVAEIELHVILDHKLRRNKLDALERVTHAAPKCVEIV
jgi:hypothetical protein